MVSLAVRDETTGQIRPWVWVVGAGFAIGGAALFLNSGGSNTNAPATTEGLGTGAGLDNLEQALQQLLDNMDPGSTGGGGSGGGTGGGGTTTGQVTTGGQGIKGVPSPAPTTRTTPTTGSTGTTSTFGRLLGPPTPISTQPTASTSVTGLPIGGVSTNRTAVSTGSINPYPISKGINPNHLGGLGRPYNA